MIASNIPLPVNRDHQVNIFWFRRDLRLTDNTGLFHALKDNAPVIPVFIFDRHILDALRNKQDRRVEFMHQALTGIHERLVEAGSSLFVLHGDVAGIWQDLLSRLNIGKVYCNHDYEPSAIRRDTEIGAMLKAGNVAFNTFKDQVIFDKGDILKPDGKPYTIYTPYRRRWQQQLAPKDIEPCPSEDLLDRFYKTEPLKIPSLESLGFRTIHGRYPAPEPESERIRTYDQNRDYPGRDATTRLSVHLRFGTVSIRNLVRRALELNETWLGELIWREFFMMILYHFPYVVNAPFKPAYSAISWRNDNEEFARWCEGQTGFPIVDAGMRELNRTGFMHNRVRMITAGFLVKHLLIDWRWGERYFAEKLLDFDLAANNGNWQWAAGCGCDAAPYFRIFNPDTQTAKFDPDHRYIKKWVPEADTPGYPERIVEHSFARERCLSAYSVVRGARGNV